MNKRIEPAVPSITFNNSLVYPMTLFVLREGKTLGKTQPFFNNLK
jgi:hypothetical protein